MSLVISKVYTYDSDVAAYITAVEAADAAAGQAQGLEAATCKAINEFIVGLKVDGLWSPIKASCILAGARALEGALVPLKGQAPTNFNFVSGDYNRKTGLAGNGSSKYLDSNRAGNADPQTNFHLAVAASVSAVNAFIGGDGNNGINSGNDFRLRSASQQPPISSVTGFIGGARQSATVVKARALGTTYNYSVSSSAPGSENVFVFRRNTATPLYSNVRLAFYSIGESLDLALLDARVTDLITALGAAIP